MKYKQILTMDDLVRFCAEQNLSYFSAEETGEQLIVSVPAEFEGKTSTDKLLLCDIKLMHTGRNRNGSNLTEDAAEKCLSSIAYKPLLANFCEIDGVRDFTSHDIEQNEDGSFTYIERQVGCFTADTPELKEDGKHKNRKYIFAKAVIPRDYTDAADIIERKGGSKVSAELTVNEMSYDAKKKELMLLDVEVSGVTLLGKNPNTGADVREGMEGARIDISDFSASNMAFGEEDAEFKEFMQTFKEALDKYTEAIAPSLTKGGNNRAMKDFEQFEDEDLKKKKGQEADSATGEDNASEGESGGNSEDSAEDQSSAQTDETEDQNGDRDGGAEGQTDEDGTNADGEETSDTETETSGESEDGTEASVGENDEFSLKTFELSHEDIRSGLYHLLLPYEESDNDYYYITAVFDDSFIYEGWCNPDAKYRQSYEKDGDELKFVGERVHMNVEYLTDSELTKLNEIRSNYSALEEKLQKYEAEPEKQKLLHSSDYEKIFKSEEYLALVPAEAHFDLSVDELTKQLDGILLSYAKSGELQFSEKPVVGMKMLPKTSFKSRKRDKYSDLIAKYRNK